MTSNQKKLLFAIAFPIVILLGLTLQKHSLRQTGVKKIFAISGYDPRDLLSGHYLIYAIDYGVEGVCSYNSSSHLSGDPESHICFDTNMHVGGPVPASCRVAIRGKCQGGRFLAGLERFYVPQEKALALERLIQSKKASIVVAIGEGGTSQVTDLLIDGIPWQEAMAAMPSPSPSPPAN
ncbi:MAG: GDYXXLXY domain-containing protein [Bdellovibrionales bacterium]|jgi:uncharacterized membrane-anchored protein|nr:GDYXXLXY domain-containing protein [Bdellovibrionales bacterium]